MIVYYTFRDGLEPVWDALTDPAFVSALKLTLLAVGIAVPVNTIFGVACAMALVRQYLTEGWYPSGTPVPAHAFTPSAALLKAIAVNSGDNDVAGTHVPDNNVARRMSIQVERVGMGGVAGTGADNRNCGLAPVAAVSGLVRAPLEPLKLNFVTEAAPLFDSVAMWPSLSLSGKSITSCFDPATKEFACDVVTAGKRPDVGQTSTCPFVAVACSR